MPEGDTVFLAATRMRDALVDPVKRACAAGCPSGCARRVDPERVTYWWPSCQPRPRA